MNYLNDNNFHSKNLIEDSYADFNLDNIFCVFKSIYNIFYLVYTNEINALISYDLMNDKKIIEIRNSHNNYITNYRHHLDSKNKTDLLISISCEDNNIKLWNANKWECILNLENINFKGYLFSACFLKENNLKEIYIITSNAIEYPEPIKVFNLKGDKLKEINNKNDITYFIDVYYENNNMYIITGNLGYIKCFDYINDCIYHKYCDIDDNKGHCSLIIFDDKLIDSGFDGNIRIWKFHTGFLLYKIKITNSALYGISLWRKEYLFACSTDKIIKIIDLKSNKIIGNLIGYNNRVLTIIKSFIHPKYGECLISQGYQNEQIKLWIKK